MQNNKNATLKVTITVAQLCADEAESDARLLGSRPRVDADRRHYGPLDCPAVTSDWDMGASAPGEDETGGTGLAGDDGQSSRTTDASRITESSGTNDGDIQLLDSIEDELDEVEQSLAQLDEDGP